MKKSEFYALIERDIIPYEERTPLMLPSGIKMAGNDYRQLAYIRRDRAIKGVQCTEVWMLKQTRHSKRDPWQTAWGRILTHYYTRDNHALYGVARNTMGWASYDTWHVGDTPHRMSAMTWISNDILGYCQDCRRNTRIRQLQGIRTQDWRVDTIREAMHDNEMETLMRYCPDAVHRTADRHTLYSATRIAVRNHYRTSATWVDYIILASQMGLDIRSARVACPTDLKGEHDRLLGIQERRRQMEQRERAKREMLALEQTKAEWVAERAKRGLINLAWSGATLSYATLDCIEDYYAEGEAMHHCVARCKYWQKTDSVIISARDAEGKRLETVEYDVEKRKVLQSRGLCNCYTDMHDAIVKAVETMMPTLTNRSQSQSIAC